MRRYTVSLLNTSSELLTLDAIGNKLAFYFQLLICFISKNA